MLVNFPLLPPLPPPLPPFLSPHLSPFLPPPPPTQPPLHSLPPPILPCLSSSPLLYLFFLPLTPLPYNTTQGHFTEQLLYPVRIFTCLLLLARCPTLCLAGTNLSLYPIVLLLPTLLSYH